MTLHQFASVTLGGKLRGDTKKSTNGKLLKVL
jgi:hypothetical protein